MTKQKFRIEGMSCSACVAAVEKAVSSLEGITDCSVSLTQGLLLAEYDEASLGDADIMAAVRSVGYRISLYGHGVKEKENPQNLRVRLILSCVFLLLLLYVAMGEMFSLPQIPFFDRNENPIAFILLQLVLATPVLVVNRKFFTVGYKAFWRRSPNMDTLVALGATASVLYGVFALGAVIYGVALEDSALVTRYVSNLYIESAAMILTLVTVGKALEDRSKKKTTEGICSLSSLLAKTASVMVDGEERVIPADEVNVGDLVLIRPGEKLPVDGVIAEGESSLDVSALTGESMPVTVGVGDNVMTASINLTGRFLLRATRVGEDTALAKIIEAVENASATKAPIARLADKVSGIFVPIVMTLSLLAGAVWFLLTKNLDTAFNHLVAVLVISCPCALGLATPVAITVGVGRLASRGIFVKKAASLEAMAAIDTVVLDKTGTVTLGSPTLTSLVCERGNEDYCLTLAASLEKGSEHPISRAIVSSAEKKELPLLPITAFEAIVGKGVYGVIGGEGVYLGNLHLMRDAKIEMGAYGEAVEGLSRSGKTAAVLAKSGRAIAVFAIADAIKANSKEAIRALKQDGVSVILLTGDRKLTAQVLVREHTLAIDEIIADVLPNGKAAVIEKLALSGKKVVMVGDGINDAPALAASSVGVAIGSGTDIALENADMVLMKNDLSDLVSAYRISKMTLTRIKQNLFWAFFYNVISIPIAAGVLSPFGIVLSPMIASAAMSLSSLFVVTNSLRTFRGV